MEKVKCSVCSGDGWYVDHSPTHYMDENLDCDEAGCPVQKQCDNCQGEGFLKEETPAEPA